MSRTTLCLATAAGLATASCALMIARYHVLGEEVKVPLGPGTWKVTLVVHGRIVGGEARLITGMPLDFGHQHIWKEACRSNEFLPKPPDAKHPERVRYDRCCVKRSILVQFSLFKGAVRIPRRIVCDV